MNRTVNVLSELDQYRRYNFPNTATRNLMAVAIDFDHYQGLMGTFVVIWARRANERTRREVPRYSSGRIV